MAFTFCCIISLFCQCVSPRYIQIYRSTHIFQKFFGSNSANSQIPQKSSWLDDYFGADLVLLGIKNKKVSYERKS